MTLPRLSVIAYPPLAGMPYPKLERTGSFRVVQTDSDIQSLPREQLDGVIVLMTSATRGCSREILEKLPNLRLIVSQGAGSDKFDLDLLSARGIRLRPVGEAVTEDVADLAMALAQMCSRGLVRADAFARNPEGWPNGRFDVGYSLYGATMGIAGLAGRIGSAIARRATAAGMTIAAIRRPSTEGLGVALHEDMRALAEASDVLMLALPGTPDLRHVVGAPELAALGKDGRLVNVGRGNLVDTAALIEALERNVIAGAGLDVLEGEPKVPARLAALPNVVLTPHIGPATWGARARSAAIAENEVLAALAEAPSS